MLTLLDLSKKEINPEKQTNALLPRLDQPSDQHQSRKKQFQRLLIIHDLDESVKENSSPSGASDTMKTFFTALSVKA